MAQIYETCNSRPDVGMAFTVTNSSTLVVMVNFHLTEDIRRLLSGDALNDCTVIVVDNAAEPDEVISICALYGATAVLRPENYGFASAINYVAPLFDTFDNVLLLNPDVEISREQIEELRDRRSSERLTGISPLLTSASGRVQVGTAGGGVSNGAVAAYFLFASHLLPKLRGTFYTRRQLLTSVNPKWLCMACLLLDGHAVSRYGLIPEDEVVYAEDLVWGWRASARGARFALATDIAVVHRQGAAGAGSRWRGATSRMLRREGGRYRALPGVVALWVGLGVRRAMRRQI